MGRLRAILCMICGFLPAELWAQTGGVPVASSMDVPVMADPQPGEAQMQEAAFGLAATPLPDLDPISPLAPARSYRPEQREGWELPSARWDDHPDGTRWSMAVMSALRGPGAPLLDVVPRDIIHWCPGYVQADRAGRAAFWTGLVSTLAWHESTHRPHAVGGGGRWFGLVQIAPGTARYRNCSVRSGQALLNGVDNLRCGIRIMAITVPRDGVVSEGMRGVAADWGPFHSSRKRNDMRDWVSSQSYCQSRRRPDPRPQSLLLRAIAPGTAVMAPLVSPEPLQRPVH